MRPAAPSAEASQYHPWFAVQVRANQELRVADFLRGRGFEPFVPLWRNRRTWSDRVKVVESALFPGYLFCRINLQDRLPMLSAPGVIRIVGYNRQPTPIAEGEISSIQLAVLSGASRAPWPYLRVGDICQIEAGPLKGLRGILIAVRGAHRLVLSVSLLQRSVAVEIDSLYVKNLPVVADSIPQVPGCEHAAALIHD